MLFVHFHITSATTADVFITDGDDDDPIRESNSYADATSLFLEIAAFVEAYTKSMEAIGYEVLAKITCGPDESAWEPTRKVQAALCESFDFHLPMQ